MKLDTNSRKRTGFDGYVFNPHYHLYLLLNRPSNSSLDKDEHISSKDIFSILTYLLQNLKRLADGDDYVLMNILFELPLEPTTTKVED
jgi:hypothetical protein